MRPKWLRGAPKKKNALEEQVVKETKKAAKKAGFEHRKVKYVNRNGACDDWFFGYDAVLIIIEFKAPGKEPDPHQWAEIRRLRRRGFVVHVIDTVEAGRALFAGLAQW